MDITVMTKTFNEGEEDEEVVKMAEVYADNRVLLEVLSFPASMPDSEIITTVQQKLNARGFS